MRQQRMVDKRDAKRSAQKKKKAAAAEKPKFYEVKEGEDINPGQLSVKHTLYLPSIYF